MKALVSAARGRTGSRIISALLARPDCPAIRGMVRGATERDPAPPGLEWHRCDMRDDAAVSRAVQGVDAVIHYAPAFDPDEASFGRRMIAAARRHGAKRFIYISVIHPGIRALPNHRAKLEVESCLVDSGLDWTILRPQHYMQAIDPCAAVAAGFVEMPYPVATRLGQVDMRDLAEAAAQVLCEPGHGHATYDIASDEHLSVEDICQRIAMASGRPIEPRAIPVDEFLARVRHRRGPLTPYAEAGFRTLFDYYAAHGIRGNSNLLRWLLRRSATSFSDYASRRLAASTLPH
ncbi:MAG: SDR family oxidoreductase [Burkholderiaceae bacterium]